MTTLWGRASRSRRRVEGNLWMTGEGVGEGNGGDPDLGVEKEKPLLSAPRCRGTNKAAIL